jgi:hypothetical protein
MVPFVLEIMATRDLGMVERFFGDALLAISGCIRSLFIAADGYDFIATDYSSLQAVVLACLAGEQWRIDAFRAGKPIYLLGASKITGVPVSEYLRYWEQSHPDPAYRQHHPDRQKIGKVSELACFNRQTQVLTARGYVDIVAVRLTDLLWDGVEWVCHAGVVAKGIAETVRLDGVGMTPNHLIFLNGFWKPASRLVSNRTMLRQALATGSASLPWLDTASGGPLARFWLRAVGAIRNRTMLRLLIFARGLALAAGYAPEKRLAHTKKCFGNTPSSCRMMGTDAAFLTEFQPALLGVDQRATPTMENAEFASMSPGLMVRTDVANFWPTLSLWTAGINRRWSLIVSKRMVTMSRAISALLRAERILATNDLSKRCSASWTPCEPVYDIAHAGPRNRFTIQTATGHLLVHNCGFQGWIPSYRAFGSEEPDDVIRTQILAWRAANPAIVEFWGGQWRGPPWRRERAELYGMEGYFIAALQSPGVVYTFRGMPFLYDATTDKLTIGLLSGLRSLTYWHPRLAQSDRNMDELAISYSGYNSNPKRGAPGWQRLSTYGGSLTENVVMGHEVEIQRHGIKALIAAGYPVPVMEVYDEVVLEVPHGFGTVGHVEGILSTPPPFAHDWPIRAEGGWRGRVYRKV